MAMVVAAVLVRAAVTMTVALAMSVTMAAAAMAVPAFNLYSYPKYHYPTISWGQPGKSHDISL